MLLRPEIQNPALLSPSVQQAIDRTTNSTVVPGNTAKLMVNGATSFPERYRMIEAAKRSINLQTLIFHSDEAGWKTAELLAKKAREGVKVRVIYDWISSADSKKEMFDMMRKAGVLLQAFNTVLDYQWHEERQREFVEHTDNAFRGFWEMATTLDIRDVDKWFADQGDAEFERWKEKNAELLARLKEYPPLLHKLNNRWHMKILTVDGKEAMLGGMNIGSEYANGGTDHRDMTQGKKSFSSQAFRDTDIFVKGPVVARVNETFAENWGYAGGANLESITAENPKPEAVGAFDTRFISHAPREHGDRNIEEWYYRMLENAQKTAYITNAYFLPTPKFCDALIAAAKRGVDVRILTNSIDTNDLPILSQGGRFYYKRLIEGGVRIYEFTKKNYGDFTTMHSKMAVFDGRASTVGSHNLDPRSFSINSEDTIVIHDGIFGMDMHLTFKKDLGSSREVTLAEFRKEKPTDRMQQWFAGRVIDDLL